VAVVGASTDPRKRGFQVLRALGESGYTGHVYPINPKGGEILGRTV
jgi:predicted CoA-binding protein